MKHNFYKVILGMLLAMALAFGAMAFAENVPAEPPTLEDSAAVEETPAAEETTPADTSDDDQAALQEALQALQNARSSKKQEALEDELKAYVEAGKLTQEQADLILNQYKTRQEARANRQSQRGMAPNGGSRQGKGGRMNGGFQGNMGGMNGMGGRMNGGRGYRGNAPQDAQTPADPAAPQSVPNDGI